MKYTHLPHLDLVGHYQFITFRTFDSMDGYLKKLSLQNKSNDRKQLDIDRYLDTSCRGAYLQGDVLTTLYDFSLYMTKKLSSTQRQIITNWVWKAWSQY